MNTAPNTIRMDTLRRGRIARVAGFGEGDPQLIAKLREVGFAEGDEVELLGQGLARRRRLCRFRLNRTMIALRKAEAAHGSGGANPE
jgi:Fe2+ transport system protein FeoA